MPVSIFFGDRDWMPKYGLEELIENRPDIKVHTISDSDHHLYFDNPKEFTEKLLEDLVDLED